MSGTRHIVFARRYAWLALWLVLPGACSNSRPRVPARRPAAHRVEATTADDVVIPAHAEPVMATGEFAGHSTRLEELYVQGARLLAADRSADAIGALERCIMLDPAFAKCYRALGLAYSQRGAEDVAVAYYEKYLRLTPDAVDAPVVRHMIQAALQAPNRAIDASE